MGKPLTTTSLIYICIKPKTFDFLLTHPQITILHNYHLFSIKQFHTSSFIYFLKILTYHIFFLKKGKIYYSINKKNHNKYLILEYIVLYTNTIKINVY